MAPHVSTGLRAPQARGGAPRAPQAHGGAPQARGGAPRGGAHSFVSFRFRESFVGSHRSGISTSMDSRFRRRLRILEGYPWVGSVGVGGLGGFCRSCVSHVSLSKVGCAAAAASISAISVKNNNDVNQEEEKRSIPSPKSSSSKPRTIVLDGANICWSYGAGLESIRDVSQTNLDDVFPDDELARVKHTGGPRTRRPRAMGLVKALEHSNWKEAGFEVSAVLPRSYYEGPLWGIADGMGLRPEAVLGEKGRGKLSKRKFQKLLSRREKRRKKQAARHKRALDQVNMNATVARLEQEGGLVGDSALVASAAEAASSPSSSSSTSRGFGGFGTPPQSRKQRRAEARALARGEPIDREEVVQEEGVVVTPAQDLVSVADRALDANGTSAADAAVADADDEDAWEARTINHAVTGEPMLEEVRPHVWRNLLLHHFVEEGRIQLVNRIHRADDDVQLLYLARHADDGRGAYVVSNDRYRDHRASLKSGLKGRRVGYQWMARTATGDDLGIVGRTGVLGRDSAETVALTAEEIDGEEGDDDFDEEEEEDEDEEDFEEEEAHNAEPADRRKRGFELASRFPEGSKLILEFQPEGKVVAAS